MESGGGMDEGIQAMVIHDGKDMMADFGWESF